MMNDEKPLSHEQILKMSFIDHDDGGVYMVDLRELFTGEEEKDLEATGVYHSSNVHPKVRNLLRGASHLYQSLSAVCQMLQATIDLNERFGVELERNGVKSNMPDLMVNELTRIQNIGFVGLRVAVEGAVKVATEVEAEQLTNRQG